MLSIHQSVTIPSTELQIRGGIADNSKIIFSYFSTKTCYNPSLELSRDGPNNVSQNMFLWRNMAAYSGLSLNYPTYPFLSSALVML